MSTEHLYPSGDDWIRPEDLEDPTDEPCIWCNGTGVYSGPMLTRWYAGPCQFCQTD